MGNSPGGFRLLRNGDSSYYFQLGKSAAIIMKDGETKWEDGGKMRKTWEVLYNVEGLTCTFSITKTTGSNFDEELQIKIKDITDREKTNHGEMSERSIGSDDRVRRVEAGLYVQDLCYSFSSIMTLEGVLKSAMSSTFVPYTRKSTNSMGGVTLTTICHYGSGTKKGLLVREWKKKKGDEKAYMGTITHYYANSNSGELYRKSRIDIGLSIVAKIRVSDNGGLDFTIDGPVQHPSSALFYMFEEVNRTRIWKPTACPHCASIERQRSWALWQSESEDSDSLPRAQGYGRHQNARNNGLFLGDGNGSFFENNIIFFRRR